MKVLVTGAAGMLGQDVCQALSERGHLVTAADRTVLDVTSGPACLELVAGHEAVVNTAAWTAVDDAEQNEAAAFEVNAVAAANLALASQRHGVRLLHVSTDYVFAGRATAPYREDAPMAPRSAYGRTKAAGEWAVRAHCPTSTIIRTAWLYGAGGPNFVNTMRRVSAERRTVMVIDDQRGQPTWSADVAAFAASVLETDIQGEVLHASSTGETTWFGFARAIFEDLGLDPERVEPTTTTAYNLPAPRPAYSVLGHERSAALGLPQLPPWRESLKHFLLATT